MRSKPPDQTHAGGPVVAAAGNEHLADITALAGIVWRAYYPGIISHEQIDYMLARMYRLEVMREELAKGISYDRLLVSGQLRAFASYGMVAPGEVKLHKLYVHPGCQRRGYGTVLLRHVEQVSSARGAQMLVLAVNKKNKQAISAYKKNGFVIREAIIADIGGGF